MQILNTIIRDQYDGVLYFFLYNLVLVIREPQF